MAATALLRLCPGTNVTVIRSTELGTIMVGEGTFAGTPDQVGVDDNFLRYPGGAMGFAPDTVMASPGSGRSPTNCFCPRNSSRNCGS
ncbi:hypothetical protein SNA_01085 [Streptomyces natalensis ATCC 27448]|uniref:Uncharacterized protein n=2 Tax=Streptomyces natalensis TaxID=68242 RepID=A0A0D7CSE7_9ACTN|nr:hypothetical protein SNA_01085 [Streptomyces natalensis ATCC 27448]